MNIRTTLLLFALQAAAAPLALAGPGNGPVPDPVVLPGFAPLAADARGVTLGAGRRYDWQASALPAEIRAPGGRLAGDMRLVARIGARDVRIDFPVRAGPASGHDAQFEGSVTLPAGMTFRVRTRVEYDGLAVVDVEASSAQRVALDGLDVAFRVRRDPRMRVMAFDPPTLYNFRPYLIPECKAPGTYRSVLGFVLPDASFWWFTDDVAAPLLGQSRGTSFECSGSAIDVRQPLLARRTVLSSPLKLRFAFLATPVRVLDGAHRSERYAGNPVPAEGNRHLWWVDATAHYALPWLELPPGAAAKLPSAEIRAYPGAERNRRAVRSWRAAGMERLPYISQRSLSFLDPEIAANEDRWRVLPRIETAAESDSPYAVGRARAILSLRGAGFADYLLARLDAIAGGLDVRGFYFDQASPAGSTNPAQLPAGLPPGSWVTDVLAMRDFYKRLAEQLHARGHAPLIYVHNSSAPVIPAFTFVTAMVQGEELMPEMRNLDYQASFDIDRIRASYAPGAFGIPTVWLEELWSPVLLAQRPERWRRADSLAWLDSPEFRRHWRGFMALALLHDIPVWTQAPRREREQVYRVLDAFGIARSRFIGYWALGGGRAGLLASAWVRPDSGEVLLVVANRGSAPVTVGQADIDALVDPGALAGARGGTRPAPAWGEPRSIPAGDFLLVRSR